MADLSVEFAGLRLEHPLICSSGPLTYSAVGIQRVWRAGASAAVTKTIRPDRALNPIPHLVRADHLGSLLNSEKWSDLPAEQWIQTEIPALRLQGGGVLIVSLGHTPAEVSRLAGAVAAAGAHAIEVVSYQSNDLARSVRAAVDQCGVPVFAKLSANWPNLSGVVEGCLSAGASGFTAIDSIGPALSLDIELRRPRLSGPSGMGWLSGRAIKPIAVRVVAELALEHDVPILGVGGVASAEDVVEMVLAGAVAVQAHSAPVLAGLGWFRRTLQSLDRWLDNHGVAAIADLRGAALPALREEEVSGDLDLKFDPAICSECRLCVEACPYGARELDSGLMTVDRMLCRSCGLCVSVCPTGALEAGCH